MRSNPLTGVIPRPPDVFANPFIRCMDCHQRVTNVRYPGSLNVPCGHLDWESSCPSWSVVDGCTCTESHE
jgi:hypothetical protein